MRCLPASLVLLTTRIATSKAKLLFGPVFPVSQYFSDEGGQQLIHLSANILTRPETPSFNGSIEVDITADDPRSKNAAEFESDYIVNLHNARSRTFTVVFQSKQASSSEHVIVLADDDILEGDETFRLRIVAARFMGQAADIFRSQGVLTSTFADVIIEDDDFVSVNWTIAQPIEVTEGYEVEVRLRAQAFGLYENPIEIGVVCAAATSTGVEPALPGRDYSFTVGTKMNFTEVETFSSFSLHDLVIPIINDNIAEPCESFICTLQGGAVNAVRSIEPNQVTIRISDDDLHDRVPVSFSQATYRVSERERSTTITLKTLADHTFSFSVTVSTRDGTASSTADYSHKRSSLTFEAGVNLITFTVTIRDEELAEPTEELYIDLESLSSSAVIKGCPSRATVYILNDDFLTLQFEGNMYMVDESDGMVDIRVIASRRSSFEYTFTVTPVGLTASNNNDYTYPTTQYTFGPTNDNEPIPSLVISIPIIDDDDNEFDENFKLTLEVSAEGEAANVTEGPISMTVVLIKDDDDVTVTFSPQNYTVTEGEPAPLMIILDKPAAKDITVTVTTMDVTATAPNDYTGGSFDVSIPAGLVKVTLSVSTLRDLTVEPAEYFKVTLSLPGAPKGCVVGTPDMSYITILDNTPIIPVQFNPANYSVKEGVDGNAVIFLEALNGHNFEFTVIVNSQDGTALDGSDYTGGPFEVTFPAGVNVVSFNVPILDEAIAEYTKLFNLDLDIPEAAAGMGVIRGSPDTATVHIMDDDDHFVSIENADYMVKENIRSIVTAAVASGLADFNYTITVETLDGTAVGGEDFVSQRYQLTFPAGQTRVEFTIVITDDNLIEATESFQLLLSIPKDLISKGVQVGPNSAATVTIKDNDDDMSHDTTGRCPTEEDSVWGIHWFAIGAESTRSARCPGEGSTDELGVAYRRCLAGVPAEWGSVDASACESVAGRAVKEKTDGFISSLKKSNGTNRDLTDKERIVFQNISQGLNAVLSPSDERNRSILPQDLKTAARFMDVVADLGENNGLFREESKETEETVADIVSNVLDERNAPAFEATAQQTDSTDPERGKAATPAVSILQSTERVANVITTTLSKTKASFTIARPNLAISGQRFLFNNLRSGIVYPGSGIRDTLASFRNEESLPQIHLPQSFLHATKGIETSLENDTVEVVNVVMNNMENYLPSAVIKQERDVEDEPEETLPASRVISSQILGYNGEEVHSKERVEVIFPVNISVRSQSLVVPPGMVQQFRCAFFNFTAEEGNQTGGWSYSGVETDVINTSHVRCIASHLTSFVVLVSFVSSVGEPPALDYITYIGCSISLLCLLACIIFYLTLRKELVEKLHNFVHLNLCIALSLGLLFFLTGIQTATANIYACKVMTALLHYFFLATFTWTLCEAVLVYILLVKVFGANDRKWIYLYLGLGWVLPIPVVVITGGTRHDYYLIRASFDQSHPHYNSIKACWLPSEKGMVFAFIGPMVTIILVNAVLLTISLVSLAKSQCDRTSKDDERAQKYMKVGKQLLKATFILVPLLGFTWIIGLFAVGEEGRVFAYLFVLANVFQGLFIFVLHVLRHEKVYGKIKTKLPSIRRRVTLINGSSATKGTRASKSDAFSRQKGGSFALESEGIIELGVKPIDEDAGSIKNVGDLDIKLNVMKENAGLSCGVGRAEK